MRIKSSCVVSGFALTVSVLAAFTFSMPASAQNFRPNRPALPSVALPAAAHGQAAMQALGEHLPGVARHYGLDAEKLRQLFQKDGDLGVDRAGRLFFADGFGAAQDQEHGTVAAGDGAAAAALVPLDQTFLMHSRPVATRKIYLDFNGHVTSGTSWQNVYTGSSSGLYTPPYDFDGNTNGFSTAELQSIQGIWQRVVEDYAPFDVDVTTEDPGVEGLRKTSSGDMNYGIRVCIGGASTDWYSTGGYGGVAYIGCFDWNSDTPCFVFENNLGNGNEKYVAEAVSHEVGHTLDLYHDGTSTQGYYAGHGSGTDSWAPIMGVGYYKNVAQWSRGEYLDANNQEDDLTKITASYNIPYLPDDFGNTFATAQVLPETSFLVDGLIERNTDVDVFRFNAGAGTLDIYVDVDSRSPNLNVQASLYNSAGQLLLVNNPTDSLGAHLYLPGMPAGTYYVTLDGVGAGSVTDGYSDYGSIGQYTLRGTLPSAGAPVAVAAATPSSGMVPLTVQLSSAGSYDPDGGAVTFSWSSDDGMSSTQPNPVLTYVAPGLHTVTLTVTDDEGMTAVAVVQINALDTPPAAPGSLTASVVSSSQVNLQWADQSANETGFKIERSTDGINFTQIGAVGAGVTTYSATGLTGGITYRFRVRAYNGSGDSAYAGPVLATTPQPLPAAPSKLTARASSQTQINLTWTDNANNETGYYVERSANGTSGWIQIAILNAGSKTFSNTGLTRNTKYYYRVQAYHGGGVSAYSNTASTTTKR